MAALAWNSPTPVAISVEPRSDLDLHAFVASLPARVSTLVRPAFLDEELPIHPSNPDALRAAVRDLLRNGGFKPSGRNKPASEYLSRGLPTINVAVDAGNAISLHGGLPVSVVDLDRLVPPLRVGVAPAGTRFPFNPSGQVLDASGLLCLFDADGVSATPVKDAQRTKTTDQTLHILCIVWGVAAHGEHGRRVAAAYRDLVARLGMSVADVVTRPTT
jgi:DNA/RNA-binding domain of Phe-tRNA-synthetase-like protein